MAYCERNMVDWNNFCREVVVFSSFQTHLQIGGPGKIVEIDESKIGKRKFHRGYAVEGQWVFGGIKRETNKCFIVPVEDCSKQTLLPLIKKCIRPGSVIISDFCKAYYTLDEEGYTHQKVNHSEHFVDTETGHHTTIEGLWRRLKVSLSAYNRRKIFFNGYIQKFIFLRLCNVNQENPFEEFLLDNFTTPQTLKLKTKEFQMNLSEPSIVLEVSASEESDSSEDEEAPPKKEGALNIS
ncbi:uncharacterized protein LOC109612604 [Musca domestica]|uniref:Uncharacterized protein LOC109612604 n=1 Tax=Musca domestica TaxID=7370 RepID=A0A9J7IGP3_MUSDO|nr:uncharacterized protein LOC109612604 [Musca domestica]XP_058985289.1 uncharacterized protein LOC109612604 [Musca domestica]